ncbi:hypothetical protein HOF92_03645 [bacterium]|jgi:hypothetical protein|nr:hypothetical protein [bacterium]
MRPYFAFLFVLLTSPYANISLTTSELLKDREFTCRRIKVHKKSVGVPEFLQDQEVSNGSVSFLEVRPDLVKVEFKYKIGSFNATHTYHITDGYEYEFFNDIVITEDTMIGDWTKTDPFENSIATRLKVKRPIFSSKIHEIWLKKSIFGVKNPFKGKDVKCVVEEEITSSKKSAEIIARQHIFEQLYAR